MDTRSTEQWIAAARAEQEAALAVVRGWLAAPPAARTPATHGARQGEEGGRPGRQREPLGPPCGQGRPEPPTEPPTEPSPGEHTSERPPEPPAQQLLLVRPDGLLLEAKAGPRRRADVFAPVPPFGLRIPLSAEPALLSARACEAVRACPPLALRLQREAAAHVLALESRLSTDETLQAAGRRRLERELLLLQAPTRPLWENWVRGRPPGHYGRLDAIVRDWLASRLDWSEQRWFAPGWGERSYLVAAGARVAGLDARVRQYLGLQRVQLEDGPFDMLCARLHPAPEQASRWCEHIGLPWRFEHVERPGRPTPKRRVAAQSS